jgi:signal transduction histidine kinase
MADHYNHITILAVDDDPVILASVADILRVGGYRYLTATHGAEGLGVMQHTTPDLIISDIMMPVMDGYQFYQAVRENPVWTTIPFIFLSAKGERKDVRYGYDLGADQYLTKPFEPEDLLSAVESRLRRMAEIEAATQDQVEQTKEQILAYLGHELRTPLSYVYGYLCLIEDGHATMDGETLNEMLRDMRLGTDRLIKLVEDLMLLTYIDSGLIGQDIARRRGPVVVADKIRNVTGDLRSRAEQKDIAITTVAPPDLTVSGVDEYVQDIIHRLIDNAVKFGKPGGRVWVRVDGSKEGVAVSVRDDGIGIAPEQQADLFQRFSQIDREKIEQQGVGIGLAIAGRLTHLHGGRIEVESQPGEGSTFTVYLPAS